VALVNETDIRTYSADGFVVLRNVLPLHTLEMLQQGVDKNLASPSSWANDYTPENSSGRFFDDYVSWKRISEFANAALQGVLPRIAGELMATTSPRFFHEHVLVKEPATATPTPWHHDDPYYSVEGMDNVSLWVPLDPVPAPIALRFIRGSHLVPRRFIPNRFVDDLPYTTAAPGFELFPTADELEGLGDTVVCPAEPGDVVAFHFRTLHSAPGTINHTTRRRVISMRYVGDDVRWTSRPWKTSPPFEPEGLNNGDELDEIRFPIIAL
jgi:ectoine hydroxylase-related dioxygenase (phytanoyl-CoA dioxygenase family)